MKTTLGLLSIALSLLVSADSLRAQSPVITSFSQNGVLVCSNLISGSAAGVEWASSLAGPWQSDWASLSAVAVGANKMINVPVPMYYRVRGIAVGSFTADGMAFIPAGAFSIGDTIDGDLARNDARPTNVYVSSFFMDTNLVSGSQWEAVLSYATNNGYALSVIAPNQTRGAKETNHPVAFCAWRDVLIWCNARSQQAGLTPVYYADAGLTTVFTNAVTQTNGANEFFPKWTANGYRLPTEAEWEKAARGGLSGLRFPWGNLISWNEANYYGNNQVLNSSTFANYYTYGLSPVGYDPVYSTNTAPPYTSPVGSFAPNGYGLYDMVGNVYHWCWDWYAGQPYPAGSAYLGGSDPRGPASGTFRVIRGCSYQGFASRARTAFRIFGDPFANYAQQGFRCVRVP